MLQSRLLLLRCFLLLLNLDIIFLGEKLDSLDEGKAFFFHHIGDGITTFSARTIAMPGVLSRVNNKTRCPLRMERTTSLKLGTSSFELDARVFNNLLNLRSQTDIVNGFFSDHNYSLTLRMSRAASRISSLSSSNATVTFFSMLLRLLPFAGMTTVSPNVSMSGRLYSYTSNVSIAAILGDRYNSLITVFTLA